MNHALPFDQMPLFPADSRDKAVQLLANACAGSTLKIIALDDDPTGVQTVSGIHVYTDWTEESIREGFLEENNLFFILTNSRALSPLATEALHRQLTQTICKVSKEMDRPFLIINRGDSTLRGHYPLETDVVRDEIEKLTGKAVDGEIICPYFNEGGRYTIDDVHYVRMGQELIPAAQTEFAKDATFGYKHDNLKEYIAEKTNGRVNPSRIHSISLAQLRALDVEGITQTLLDAHDYDKFIVNATDDHDLMVFSAALHHAIRAGKTFCCRTAAAFVKAMGNIPSRPLLTRGDMVANSSKAGGLILVGSHTQKTTEQLKALLTLPSIVPMEMNTDLVLEDGALIDETVRIIAACNDLIVGGKTPVVFTKRTVLLLPEDTPETALARSVQISQAVQSIAAGIQHTPAFIIAKGGITSSDIGVHALHVRKALVLGQICPGVPVWKTGAESRFPSIPYIIFPGNVGQLDTLMNAAAILLENESKEAHVL